MHTHHFSLLGGKLYLNSFQRSADIPLGINFNQVQVFVLLALMAQITGHKPGKAYHKITHLGLNRCGLQGQGCTEGHTCKMISDEYTMTFACVRNSDFDDEDDDDEEE